MNNFQIHRAYPDRTGRNRKKRIWPYLTLIIIIAAAGYFWYQESRYQYLIETPVNSSDSSDKSFIIKQGDSINEIGKKLTEKNLVMESGAFAQYLKKNGLDRKIVAGRFLISPSDNIRQIAEKITDTKNSQAVITIPEGSTIQNIDDKLVAQNLIQSGEFVSAVKNFTGYEKYPFLEKKSNDTLPYPLEGYLFPDTYFVDSANFSSQDLIQLMLKNFKNKTAEFYAPTLEIAGKNRSFNDLVIMASMVEKEVRTGKDLPIVAGILWKRLDQNWQLGADATLLYLNNKDRQIEYHELKQDNPYNTRINTGLPPGPICNPGIKSIMAALNPEESRYYYYLTKPDTGEVVYAATNDEHNLNKQRFLY